MTRETYEKLAAIANDASAADGERESARRMMAQYEKSEAVVAEKARQTACATFAEALKPYRQYF